MKSKTWAVLLGAVMFLSLGLGLWLMQGQTDAAGAEIWSEGVLIKTVLLTVNQSFVVETDWGSNMLTVKDGAIAVIEADCPDHYCVARGFCNGGSQIVCLPNRLVIKFVGESQLDGVSG